MDSMFGGRELLVASWARLQQVRCQVGLPALQARTAALLDVLPHDVALQLISTFAGPAAMRREQNDASARGTIWLALGRTPWKHQPVPEANFFCTVCGEPRKDRSDECHDEQAFTGLAQHVCGCLITTMSFDKQHTLVFTAQAPRDDCQCDSSQPLSEVDEAEWSRFVGLLLSPALSGALRRCSAAAAKRILAEGRDCSDPIDRSMIVRTISRRLDQELRWPTRLGGSPINFAPNKGEAVWSLHIFCGWCAQPCPLQMSYGSPGYWCGAGTHWCRMDQVEQHLTAQVFLSSTATHLQLLAAPRHDPAGEPPAFRRPHCA